MSTSNLVAMAIKVALALFSSATSDGIDKSDVAPSPVEVSYCMYKLRLIFAYHASSLQHCNQFLQSSICLFSCLSLLKERLRDGAEIFALSKKSLGAADQYFWPHHGTEMEKLG